jgi:uncharacterized RDD family membrane protein YckC
MTAEHEPGEERQPRTPEDASSLVVGPLPTAHAPPVNGASSDATRAQARADHAARAARAQAAASLRARAGAAARGPAARDTGRDGTYAGLITRTIAYVLDGAVINLVALVVGAAAALALSIFHLPGAVETAVAAVLAVAYFVFVVGYFVAFWSTTGQTVGSRVMRIRVIDAHGAPTLKPRRALVRVAGLVLATIPLFAGFLIMLWDGRRRCLQDHLARTLVIHAPPQVRVVRRPVIADRQADIG